MLVTGGIPVPAVPGSKNARSECKYASSQAPLREKHAACRRGRRKYVIRREITVLMEKTYEKFDEELTRLFRIPEA
jgi:hypothetical protein